MLPYRLRGRPAWMSPSEHRGMSFRTKLVLALFAVVAPVLIAALFVLHRETNRQIQSFIATSLTTAQAQLAQVERIRQTELRQLGIRFAGQNRWPAALQEALSGDTAYLRSQVEYDLGLAGVNNALAAFADLDGNAVFATVAGQSVEPSAAVPAALLDRLARGDTAIFGYHPLGAQLFSVHPVVLEMFEQPIGVVLLGSPLDDGVARLIGSAIGAEVCFVAGEHCVASTDGARDRALARAILQAARDSTRRRAEVDGHNYAFVSQPLGGAAANVVLALLLDQVLAPFRRIQQALLAVAVVSLLLAIMLALVLGHGLAVPVRLLVRATERVARGEYDTRVEVRSRDELGTLADAFNQMTYGLMLKDKYRGVLDKVVSRDIADELLKGEIQLGGENREVTMLFADIRGFTPLTEGME